MRKVSDLGEVMWKVESSQASHREVERATPKAADQPAQRIGRRLMRAIAVCALGFVLLPLAKAVELSCALALGAPAPASNGAPEMSVVGRIGEFAGTLAAAVGALSGMCAAALAALALATIVLALRARTPRIGATVTALALFAALSSHASELRGALLALDAGAMGISVALAIVVATTLLAARWIEDVALTVALEKSIDPLAITADIDAEARDAARLGVSGVDSASYRLAGALGRGAVGHEYDAAVVDEPALSGRGSPIPCRMPDDGPLPLRTA